MAIRQSGKSASQPSTVRGNLVAGAIGSVLEWYDFAVYGYLAPILGNLFFPADDPVASLLAAFGVFAIGFAARPVGGALFGYIGDKFGRKPTLLISVTAMGAATFLIGIMPTHARAGAAAAIALVLLRIVEGLSVGGEFTSSVILLAEHAPPDRRASYAIWPELGCIVGFLLGSGIGAASSTLLGSERMRSWGWRVPFLLGAVIALWGIVFRRQMTESPELEAARQKTRGIGLFTTVRWHWRIIVRFVALLLMAGIGFYMMFVYAASYLTQHMHVSTAHALDVNTWSLFVMLAVLAPSAILSDRIGRKPLIYVATLGTVLLAWPLWWLMNHERLSLIFAGQVGFAVLFALGYGSVPALMAELLPAEVRCTGIGIGYNVAIGIFGGTAPLVATYLISRTGNDFVPAYYLMAVSAISFIALLGLPETAGRRAGRSLDHSIRAQ